MKPGIHPAYGEVAFRDRSTGDVLVTRSTLVSSLDPTHTVEVDGRTYPVLDVDVTRHSHPFWTGRGRVLDSEGRVEAFERRYGRAAGKRGSS
ncbi:type B 50S ribosomal protein L31 [Nocardioides flavescens]|uniref:50S ribosomal protein L31 n=1 Tax=Nocardioides flavescens TaxID=2691959 RepID=A0A6L7EW43_9ACTN|nr:type B 50S ribosomal protein L31 [Nocardioides flavescens]